MKHREKFTDEAKQPEATTYPPPGLLGLVESAHLSHLAAILLSGAWAGRAPDEHYSDVMDPERAVALAREIIEEAKK